MPSAAEMQACSDGSLKWGSMVGTPGLEPGSLTAADFKSAVFTNFTMLPISFNGITKFHAFANLMLTYF